MTLSKAWLAATGIECDEPGKPKGGSPLPFVLSAEAMLLVAGMTRHIFGMGGIPSPGAALGAGPGSGLFFISPWIMINNACEMRPFRLTLINGGYATFGCAPMGLVLTLFQG